MSEIKAGDILCVCHSIARPSSESAAELAPKSEFAADTEDAGGVGLGEHCPPVCWFVGHLVMWPTLS